MSSPIYQAIKQISDEKNIPFEVVIQTIESALAAAYNKDFGNKKTQNVKVTFEPESGNFDVFDVKTIVEDQELPTEEEILAMQAAEEEAERQRKFMRPMPQAPAAPAPAPAPAEEAPAAPAAEAEDVLPNVAPGEIVASAAPDAEPAKKFNPRTEIMISDAKVLKSGAKIGDEVKSQLEVPSAFGRMAAMTAKQVIMQSLREAERAQIYAEFKQREHELINATVQRRDGKLVFIDLGRVTAVMPPEEQIPTERYAPGDRVKVYVTDVRLTSRGPEIIVSRAHREIIRQLFAFEIPEVQAGTVVIHAIAREAGNRSKVAVSSNQPNVDPIGSCIGQRGTRIQTIIGELANEKIDIIQHDADPARFIGNALSPAKVATITLDEMTKTADVLVNADQLSLAIGKGGQNVRLASRLTGWKINIRENVGGATTADETAEGAEGTSEESAAEEGEAKSE
jgi:N utilization substance protein A